MDFILYGETNGYFFTPHKFREDPSVKNILLKVIICIEFFLKKSCILQTHKL